MIDSSNQRCWSNETALNWNRKSPQGPGWSAAPDSQLNPNRQVLTSLNGVAAGSYVVMASLWGSNSDVTSYARYYCDIVTPNADTQTISDLPQAHADGQTGGLVAIKVGTLTQQ